MKRFAVLALILIVILSCSKQKDEFGEHGSLVIEFGTACGWCSGEETITVSSEKADYLRLIPCGENKGTTDKTIEISEGKWNDIISCFDYSHFLTLDYNECNIYADGCDEFIKITHEGSSHEIRYSPSENIDGLNDLRQELNNLMSEISSD